MAEEWTVASLLGGELFEMQLELMEVVRMEEVLVMEVGKVLQSPKGQVEIRLFVAGLFLVLEKMSLLLRFLFLV